MKEPKRRYKDFDQLGKNIIRTLRMRPNAVIIYPSNWKHIGEVIEYLNERGYKAVPRLDKSGQCVQDKIIDSVSKSNTLMSRILRTENK